MRHYSATVQCQGCGHRFTVCFHTTQSVLSDKGFSVYCPQNASKIHVPVEALVAVESCPSGAVIVRDMGADRGTVARCGRRMTDILRQFFPRRAGR
jgi:hypothetical protein